MEGIKPVETDIMVSPTIALKLNELLIFPHGLDGLHIWEAGIVLARFVNQSADIFAGKKILELGTGVGIGGIAMLTCSKCAHVDLTDYNKEVLVNADKNIAKNKIEKHRYATLLLDWTKHASFSKQYDAIIGSDLIYSGAPLHDLYYLIVKSLIPGGKAYIIIPSQRFKGETFLGIVEEKKELTVEKIPLSSAEYALSPLRDADRGRKVYPGLLELQFWVYIFTKI